MRKKYQLVSISEPFNSFELKRGKIHNFNFEFLTCLSKIVRIHTNIDFQIQLTSGKNKIKKSENVWAERICLETGGNFHISTFFFLNYVFSWQNFW